jgi:hypothetical protein
VSLPHFAGGAKGEVWSDVDVNILLFSITTTKSGNLPATGATGARLGTSSITPSRDEMKLALSEYRSE